MEAKVNVNADGRPLIYLWASGSDMPDGLVGRTAEEVQAILAEAHDNHVRERAAQLDVQAIYSRWNQPRGARKAQGRAGSLRKRGSADLTLDDLVTDAYRKWNSAAVQRAPAPEGDRASEE